MARKKKTSTAATADVATLKEVIATAGDEVNPLAAEEYKCLGEEGTRELIKLCKDNFLQDVTAQGDGKVLTLSASPTADGKGVSITGEADTYTKQEITSMISTSQGGGITGATTDATPPLSLDAEVSDGLLNISGSVDLSSKQDALNYYSEYATDAAIIVNNSRMGVSDTQVSVNSPAVEIYSSQDSNSHITMISNSDNIQLYKGISLNTSDKVTYNDKEIATVDDIPTQVSALENDAGYITESAVEGKQDKLNLYSEEAAEATINAGDGIKMFTGGDFYVEANVINLNPYITAQYNNAEIATITDVNTKQDKLQYYTESSNYAQISTGDMLNINCPNIFLQSNNNNGDLDIRHYTDGSVDSRFELLQGKAYITGEAVNIYATKDKAYYNDKEIATVDDTLESYREKYADTLSDNIKGMFSSIPTYVSLYGAKIMDVEEDLLSCRIRITFDVNGSATYTALYITYQNIVVGTCVYGNGRGNFYQSFDLLFRINDGEIYFPSSVYTLNTL